jgi:hypothetical protein
MGDPHDFPTDLGDDGETPRQAMRWTASIVAMSTLGLALLNPGAIDDWVNDLPPTPLTLRLTAIADAYMESAIGTGLGAGHARLHSAWKTAERTDWAGRRPIETADASRPRS